MKRFACAALLAGLFLTAPVLARADVFSWTTPWGAGSFSATDGGQNGTASGSGTVNDQPYSWGYTWDAGNQTGDVNASYGDNSYDFSFSWGDIFAALFGL